MGELYGEFNLVSHEWTDGLIASIARQVKADTTTAKKWIVFDGPVDALWIENMNTVLDDNKMLCLANGERIKLPPVVTMMFEVQDLAVASPATVSRCGMVFLEPVYLGWKPVAKTWAVRMEKENILPGVRCFKYRSHMNRKRHAFCNCWTILLMIPFGSFAVNVRRKFRLLMLSSCKYVSIV